MFIIVNWWYDGSGACVVTDDDGLPMKFSTEEEAQEYCNVEMNGNYKIIDMEV